MLKEGEVVGGEKGGRPGAHGLAGRANERKVLNPDDLPRMYDKGDAHSYKI